MPLRKSDAASRTSGRSRRRARRQGSGPGSLFWLLRGRRSSQESGLFGPTRQIKSVSTWMKRVFLSTEELQSSLLGEVLLATVDTERSSGDSSSHKCGSVSGGTEGSPHSSRDESRRLCRRCRIGGAVAPKVVLKLSSKDESVRKDRMLEDPLTEIECLAALRKSYADYFCPGGSADDTSVRDSWEVLCDGCGAEFVASDVSDSESEGQRSTHAHSDEDESESSRHHRDADDSDSDVCPPSSTSARFSRSYYPFFVEMLEAMEDANQYCLILEHCSGGDLCTLIQRDGPLSNLKAKKFSRQIAEAVMVLHTLGYCHLDLSLENVLYDCRSDSVKLCDFGLCRKLVAGRKYEPTSIRPGKKGYIAPEINNFCSFYGDKADVFSLGVLLFILLTGFPPFNRAVMSDACFRYFYNKDCSLILSKWDMLDSVIPLEAVDLFNRIFVHDSKRISMEELIRHPYMAELCSPTATRVSSTVIPDRSHHSSLFDLDDFLRIHHEMVTATTTARSTAEIVSRPRSSRQRSRARTEDSTVVKVESSHRKAIAMKGSEVDKSPMITATALSSLDGSPLTEGVMVEAEMSEVIGTFEEMILSVEEPGSLGISDGNHGCIYSSEKQIARSESDSVGSSEESKRDSTEGMTTIVSPQKRKSISSDTGTIDPGGVSDALFQSHSVSKEGDTEHKWTDHS